MGIFDKIEEQADIKNMNAITQLMKPPIKEKGLSVPHIDVHKKGSVYQADLLRLPNDNGYKYSLVVVDTYDRSMDAEPMKSTTSLEAVKAMKAIFKRKYLNPPILMIQTDNGSEFKKDFNNYVEKELKVIHKYGMPYRSRQQAMVESMNGIISKAIARYQNAIEITTGKRSTEWTDYLPKIVKVLNQEIVRPNPRENINNGPVCNKSDCILLKEGTKVRIPYEKPVDNINEKRQADSRWRVVDIRWRKKIYTISQVILRSNQPPMYLLEGIKNTAFTRSNLQVVDENEKMPEIPMVEKYEVEKFLSKEKKNNLVYFKVKWKNYPISQATLEKRTTLIKDLGKQNFTKLENELLTPN
jgi:transposase InsO family protein